MFLAMSFLKHEIREGSTFKVTVDTHVSLLDTHVSLLDTHMSLLDTCFSSLDMRVEFEFLFEFKKICLLKLPYHYIQEAKIT